MARKSKEKTATADAMRKQLERIQAEAEQEQQAEIRVLEDTEKQINEIIGKEDLFCGVILTPQDVLSVVEMAMTVKENIKIPFKLYYND